MVTQTDYSQDMAFTVESTVSLDEKFSILEARNDLFDAATQPLPTDRLTDFRELFHVRTQVDVEICELI